MDITTIVSILLLSISMALILFIYVPVNTENAIRGNIIQHSIWCDDKLCKIPDGKGLISNGFIMRPCYDKGEETLCVSHSRDPKLLLSIPSIIDLTNREFSKLHERIFLIEKELAPLRR